MSNETHERIGHPPKGRDGEPLLVFVHIRKTAGKTLRQVLYREYGRPSTCLVKNFFTRPEQSRASVRELATDPGEMRVVHGHMLFWPELGWPESTRFITMLRDPVERTLSHYYWAKEKKPDLYGKGIEAAFADGLIRDNFQTRTIADAMSETSPLGREALETAVERLDRFAVVGLTDRFNESLALMTQVFGWSWQPYRRDNTTRDRKTRDEIEPETIRMIEELNALDQELYQAARVRLDADLAAQDDAFALELEALERATARPA